MTRARVSSDPSSVPKIPAIIGFLFRGRTFRTAPLGVAAGLGLLALSLLGLVGYAFAATFSVTLTSGGPQPGLFTAALGDTVTFVNSDSVAHAVVDRAMGLQSPALGPGQSWPFVLTKSGRFTYAQEERPTGFGQIVVERSGTVTLKTSRRSLAYGTGAFLSGTTSLPAFPVKIEQRGKADVRWNELAKVTPTPEGSFVLEIRPQIGSQYRANVLDGELFSSLLEVDVRPVLTLAAKRRTAPGGSVVTLMARVVPTDAAKSVDLMRFDSRRQDWKRLMTRAVPSSGKVSFQWRVEYGRSLLRASVVKRGLVRGFAEASSRAVQVRGTGTAPPKRRRGR